MPNKIDSVIRINQIIWNQMFLRTIVKMRKASNVKVIRKES